MSVKVYVDEVVMRRRCEGLWKVARIEDYSETQSALSKVQVSVQKRQYSEGTG